MAKGSTKVAGPENIAPDLLGLTVDISTLTLDPRNARKHNDRNLAAVAASLTRFGQTKPIVVDADGVVLAGNGSLTAAKQLGWKRIAVSRVPLAGADARAYAIADNRTGELAEWDWEKVAVQLDEQVDVFGTADMQQLGWSRDDLASLSIPIETTTPPPLEGHGAHPPQVQLVVASAAPPPASDHTPVAQVKMVPLYFNEADSTEMLSLANKLKETYAAAHLSELALKLLREAAQ